MTKRETTQPVIDQILDLACIEDHHLVLEPSAGHGLLADGIKRANPNIDIHCVELNQACRSTLKEKGYNLVGHDFFLFGSSNKYDRVLAAPNFKDNVDCDHIRKMYDCLRPGGKLVSLMSPFWMTGESQRQSSFREWLADKRHKMVMLPDMTFIENGKTIPTAVICIEK